MTGFVMTQTLGRPLALGAVLALSVGVGSAAAQQRGADDDWCRGDQWGDDRAGVCVVREFKVAATAGTLSVSGTNGGISVEGEARGDVRILAKIVATAETDARAREILGTIQLNPTIDQVEATGPQTRNREGWSVSYRLYVPRALGLALRTTNGGISIRDIDSKVDFKTTNGGVKLTAVNGDIKGRTTNGGVDIDLDGTFWSGEGLDVETTNGGVKVTVPETYSARFEASTDNGGLNVDFPGVTQQRRRSRDLTTQLGSGGAPIRVRTTNGGVRLTRK
jgi:Putative adhesin